MSQNLIPTTSRPSRVKLRRLWLLVVIVTLLSLAIVLTPALLIQPFRPQTQQALEISYTLKRWSPILTLIALVSVAALVLRLWAHSRRWWRKTLLVITLLLAITPAWFARQNHFEWMFNPLKNSTYAKVMETTFVTDADMVLAVKLGNEAVAYPVRQMAYHHLVADVVGGVPLVATY